MAVNFVTREQPAVDTAEAGSANEPTVGRLRQTVDVDPDGATPDQSSEQTRSARRPMGAVRAPEVLPLTVTDEVPVANSDAADNHDPDAAAEQSPSHQGQPIDGNVPILTPDPALNHPNPLEEEGMTGFYTPAREATDDGIVAIEPAEATQPASATQWYVMTESLDMSLRLLAGAVLCEGANGEMVQTIDEAVHAARFDIVDDDLWCSALVGDVWVNEIEVRGLTPVSPGSRVTIGDTTFLISESPTELTGAVPIIEDDSFLDDNEPQEPYAGLPLFYETPAEVEEIVISEPAPRPHLAAQKARLTGSFDVVDETPLPQEDTQEVLETLPMAEPEPQSLRTPTLRVARAKAKARFPATATLLFAVLAALGLAVYTLSDHPVAQSYWQAALAYVQPLIDETPVSGNPPPTIDPSLTQSGEPETPASSPDSKPVADANVETPPTIFEAVDAEPTQVTTDLTRDARFNELTSLIWLDDITSTSHQRTLALLSEFMPEHGAAIEEHVRHYISRLSGITEGVRLESLTTSLAATLAGQRIYEEDMRGLESQVRELTQGMRELALLHAQAADLFARDAITLPPGRNVVATAKEMLAIDPDNVQANRWLTRAADVMVERAQGYLARGDAFNARSLIEDVRAFNPNHGGARALWRQLSDY